MLGCRSDHVCCGRPARAAGAMPRGEREDAHARRHRPPDRLCLPAPRRTRAFEARSRGLRGDPAPGRGSRGQRGARRCGHRPSLGRDAGGPLLRARLRARARPLLPDGRLPPTGCRQARGAPWPGGAGRGCRVPDHRGAARRRALARSARARGPGSAGCLRGRGERLPRDERAAARVRPLARGQGRHRALDGLGQRRGRQAARLRPLVRSGRHRPHRDAPRLPGGRRGAGLRRQCPVLLGPQPQRPVHVRRHGAGCTAQRRQGTRGRAPVGKSRRWRALPAPRHQGAGQLLSEACRAAGPVGAAGPAAGGPSWPTTPISTS